EGDGLQTTAWVPKDEGSTLEKDVAYKNEVKLGAQQAAEDLTLADNAAKIHAAVSAIGLEGATLDLAVEKITAAVAGGADLESFKLGMGKDGAVIITFAVDPENVEGEAKPLISAIVNAFEKMGDKLKIEGQYNVLTGEVTFTFEIEAGSMSALLEEFAKTDGLNINTAKIQSGFGMVAKEGLDADGNVNWVDVVVGKITATLAADGSGTFEFSMKFDKLNDKMKGAASAIGLIKEKDGEKVVDIIIDAASGQGFLSLKGGLTQDQKEKTMEWAANNGGEAFVNALKSLGDDAKITGGRIGLDEDGNFIGEVEVEFVASAAANVSLRDLGGKSFSMANIISAFGENAVVNVIVDDKGEITLKAVTFSSGDVVIDDLKEMPKMDEVLKPVLEKLKEIAVDENAEFDIKVMYAVDTDGKLQVQISVTIDDFSKIKSIDVVGKVFGVDVSEYKDGDPIVVSTVNGIDFFVFSPEEAAEKAVVISEETAAQINAIESFNSEASNTEETLDALRGFLNGKLSDVRDDGNEGAIADISAVAVALAGNFDNFLIPDEMNVEKQVYCIAAMEMISDVLETLRNEIPVDNNGNIVVDGIDMSLCVKAVNAIGSITETLTNNLVDIKLAGLEDKMISEMSGNIEILKTIMTQIPTALEDSVKLLDAAMDAFVKTGEQLIAFISDFENITEAGQGSVLNCAEKFFNTLFNDKTGILVMDNILAKLDTGMEKYLISAMEIMCEVTVVLIQNFGDLKNDVLKKKVFILIKQAFNSLTNKKTGILAVHNILSVLEAGGEKFLLSALDSLGNMTVSMIENFRDFVDAGFGKEAFQIIENAFDALIGSERGILTVSNILKILPAGGLDVLVEAFKNLSKMTQALILNFADIADAGFGEKAFQIIENAFDALINSNRGILVIDNVLKILSAGGLDALVVSVKTLSDISTAFITNFADIADAGFGERAITLIKNALATFINPETGFFSVENCKKILKEGGARLLVEGAVALGEIVTGLINNFEVMAEKGFGKETMAMIEASFGALLDAKNGLLSVSNFLEILRSGGKEVITANLESIGDMAAALLSKLEVFMAADPDGALKFGERAVTLVTETLTKMAEIGNNSELITTAEGLETIAANMTNMGKIVSAMTDAALRGADIDVAKLFKDSGCLDAAVNMLTAAAGSEALPKKEKALMVAAAAMILRGALIPEAVADIDGTVGQFRLALRSLDGTDKLVEGLFGSDDVESKDIDKQDLKEKLTELNKVLKPLLKVTGKLSTLVGSENYDVDVNYELDKETGRLDVTIVLTIKTDALNASIKSGNLLEIAEILKISPKDQAFLKTFLESAPEGGTVRFTSKDGQNYAYDAPKVQLKDVAPAAKTASVRDAKSQVSLFNSEGLTGKYADIFDDPMEQMMRFVFGTEDRTLMGWEDYLKKGGIIYESDSESMDIWSPPSVTILRGAGDCDDFSIASATMLAALGYNPEMLVLNGAEGAHAITAFMNEDGTYSYFDNANFVTTNERTLSALAKNILNLPGIGYTGVYEVAWDGGLETLLSPDFAGKSEFYLTGIYWENGMTVDTAYAGIDGAPKYSGDTVSFDVSAIGMYSAYEGYVTEFLRGDSKSGDPEIGTSEVLGDDLRTQFTDSPVSDDRQDSASSMGRDVGSDDEIKIKIETPSGDQAEVTVSSELNMEGHIVKKMVTPEIRKIANLTGPDSDRYVTMTDLGDGRKTYDIYNNEDGGTHLIRMIHVKNAKGVFQESFLAMYLDGATEKWHFSPAGKYASQHEIRDMLVRLLPGSIRDIEFNMVTGGFDIEMNKMKLNTTLDVDSSFWENLSSMFTDTDKSKFTCEGKVSLFLGLDGSMSLKEDILFTSSAGTKLEQEMTLKSGAMIGINTKGDLSILRGDIEIIKVFAEQAEASTGKAGGEPMPGADGKVKTIHVGYDTEAELTYLADGTMTVQNGKLIASEGQIFVFDDSFAGSESEFLIGDNKVEGKDGSLFMDGGLFKIDREVHGSTPVIFSNGELYASLNIGVKNALIGAIEKADTVGIAKWSSLTIVLSMANEKQSTASGELLFAAGVFGKDTAPTHIQLAGVLASADGKTRTADVLQNYDDLVALDDMSVLEDAMGYIGQAMRMDVVITGLSKDKKASAEVLSTLNNLTGAYNAAIKNVISGGGISDVKALAAITGFVVMSQMAATEKEQKLFNTIFAAKNFAGESFSSFVSVVRNIDSGIGYMESAVKLISLYFQAQSSSDKSAFAVFDFEGNLVSEQLNAFTEKLRGIEIEDVRTTVEDIQKKVSGAELSVLDTSMQMAIGQISVAGTYKDINGQFLFDLNLDLTGASGINAGSVKTREEMSVHIQNFATILKLMNSQVSVVGSIAGVNGIFGIQSGEITGSITVLDNFTSMAGINAKILELEDKTRINVGNITLNAALNGVAGSFSLNDQKEINSTLFGGAFENAGKVDSFREKMAKITGLKEKNIFVRGALDGLAAMFRINDLGQKTMHLTEVVFENKTDAETGMNDFAEKYKEYGYSKKNISIAGRFGVVNGVVSVGEGGRLQLQTIGGILEDFNAADTLIKTISTTTGFAEKDIAILCSLKGVELRFTTVSIAITIVAEDQSGNRVEMSIATERKTGETVNLSDTARGNLVKEIAQIETLSKQDNRTELNTLLEKQATNIGKEWKKDTSIGYQFTVEAGTFQGRAGYNEKSGMSSVGMMKAMENNAGQVTMEDVYGHSINKEGKG
ncbi:MAG: hypothetical protein KAI70_00885, partial [Candidatus Omnitrophica bacterium]|nr:hypothetical protein [Candidatus Omnitrophota bacterium]